MLYSNLSLHDKKIMMKGETFYLHNCILSVRCPKLMEIIEKDKLIHFEPDNNRQDYLIISSIQVCKVLLEFIYAESLEMGNFFDWKVDSFAELFECCEKLNMARLFWLVSNQIAPQFIESIWKEERLATMAQSNQWVRKLISQKSLNEETASTWKKEMRKLFENPRNYFADHEMQVTSEKDEQQKLFHLHKIFLSNLEFFKMKLIMSEMNYGKNEHVTPLSMSVFEFLLRTIYEGVEAEEDIEEETALEIIAHNKYYQIDDQELLSRAVFSLKRCIGKSNCLSIFQIAFQYGMEEIMQDSLDYLVKDQVIFSEVVQDISSQLQESLENSEEFHSVETRQSFAEETETSLQRVKMLKMFQFEALSPLICTLGLTKLRDTMLERVFYFDISSKKKLVLDLMNKLFDWVSKSEKVTHFQQMEMIAKIRKELATQLFI